MNIKNKEIYSEVYQVINLLGNEYIDKLPTKLFNMLEEKRDINYEPKYTDDVPLNEQNVKRETLAIIALLHLNYWCEGVNEKNELSQIFKDNEDRYQEEVRRKYYSDNCAQKYVQENIVKNEVCLVEHKESVLKKIIDKIKKFFI
jgi:hypothetical protein